MTNLLHEGLKIRDSCEKDYGLIFDAWRKSGLTKFLKGEYQPFPQFEETINCALKHRNTKLLTRIYQSEIGKVMNSAIKSMKIICDEQDDSLIYAFGSTGFKYVKHIMRGLGLEELL